MTWEVIRAGEGPGRHIVYWRYLPGGPDSKPAGAVGLHGAKYTAIAYPEHAPPSPRLNLHLGTFRTWRAAVGAVQSHHAARVASAPWPSPSLKGTRPHEH